MMPSAATIFSMHALTPSSFCPGHVLSWVSAHLRQAMHPRRFLLYSCTSSVSMPSASSSANTLRTRNAVLPSLRALPLNATTFMSSSPHSTSSACARSVMCRCASRAVQDTPGSGNANTLRPNVRARSSLNP